VVTTSRSELQQRGFALRRATLFDIRAVHRLERVIFPRDAYSYLDLALVFLVPGIINLKIVDPDGQLAGFVSGIRAQFTRDRSWIITIGVALAHQRRGLGSWLLVAAEARLKRPCVRLTVREGNLPAVRMYERAGYRVVERKRGYYRDGEAGLIMEKRPPFTAG
jgi:ribosomal-protein-alanine N-acetyltransferase